MDWSIDGLKAAIINETTYVSNKIDNELTYASNQLDKGEAAVLNEVTYAKNVVEKVFFPDASNDRQSGQDESDDTASAASTQSANGVPAPSGEEWYYQKAQEIQNEHPEMSQEQITNKMSEEIWNNNYNALMDDIAHSKTPEERDQKIKDYQAELDNYKASGINVDNDVEYLRDVQGMPKETISSKIISLMSNYSFKVVEYQYSVPPDSFAFIEIPKDGISIEKYTDYQIQKNDAENTVHNSLQQQVEELLEKAKKLQFINGRQLTDADREAGYQLMPTLNGLTYVRARYEDGNWVIHPDDRQLVQESNQDVAKGMLLGGVLPGVIKGVNASGKSLLKAFTQESSENFRFKEVNRFTAEETNQWFVDNIKPDYKPPYRPGTVVKEIELSEKTTFVRVYDNNPGGSGKYGSWVMDAKEIEGLTPNQIQDKFALPNIPKYVCDVELESATRIRVGEVNPLDGWGDGGGTQYDLIGQRIGKFINERLLE